MAAKDDQSLQSVLKEPWPIFVVGVGIMGLLAWISWDVTRPEKAGAERR